MAVTTCSPWSVLISTDRTWSSGTSTPPPKALPSRAAFGDTTQLPATQVLPALSVTSIWHSAPAFRPLIFTRIQLHPARGSTVVAIVVPVVVSVAVTCL